MNDLKGRFYNRVAKSLAIQFYTLGVLMTDKEEFAARSQLKWTREGEDGYCSIAAGEWAAWSPTRTTLACSDQSKSTAS